MSSNSLDQAVKGAAPLTTNIETIKRENGGDSRASPTPSDPTSLLPSSPPQIYLNLLILEASLRQQYLTLRARKRQHTLVVFGLVLWIATTFYLQFLRPREDGIGIGGSVYWLVDTAEKVALIGGVVMSILFWATGQWERGMRWPRKWLSTTNRGLRTMNCKIVILRGTWLAEMLGWLRFLLPWQPSTPGSNYRYVEYTTHEKRGNGRRGLEWAEEDVASGGDHVKILLLPKQFTPDFRENWELFRAEYWEQENQRRVDIRQRIKTRDRDLAKQQGGWLWWTGWRGWAHLWGTDARSRVPSRDSTPPHHVHSFAHQAGLKQQAHRRVPSVRRAEREGSHSRSSSRSSVISNPDAELRERRWSTASTGSTGGGERRRRSKLIEGLDGTRQGSITARPPGRLTPTAAGVALNVRGSRPSTPSFDTKRWNTMSTNPGEGEVKVKSEPAD